MTSGILVGRRLMLLLMTLVAWIGLSSAVFAVAAGSAVDAAVTGLIGLAAIGAVIDGRLVQSAEGKPLNTGSSVVIAFIALAVIFYEARNLTFEDVLLLGEIRLPAVIRIVGAVGGIVLSLALVLELLRLIRAKPD